MKKQRGRGAEYFQRKQPGEGPRTSSGRSHTEERWRARKKRKGKKWKKKKKKKDKKKKVKYRRKELAEKVQRKDCKLSYSEEERGRERKER